MRTAEKALTRTARSVVVIGLGLALMLGVLPLVGTALAQNPPPNAPCPEGTPASEFLDRDQARSGHAPSIDCAAFHAIALGGTDAAGNPVYLPAGVVNRAQMATFIANTLEAAGLELPEGDAPDEFTDTAATVHRARINALARAEIVAGHPDGTYRPQAPVTRAQMASFIVQAGEWALDEELAPDAGPHFGDTAGNVHEANIDAGFEHGLFEGRVAPNPDAKRSGQFAPRDGTRRDQMATFLSRLLDYLWEAPGIVGQVTDATTGEPIVGATVSAFAEPVDGAAEPSATDTTGDAGTYHMEVDPGSYTVAATAEGYADADVHTGVLVEQGRLTVVNIALEADAQAVTGTVAGTVTDATGGQPIAGASITVVDGDGEIGQAITEADGTYTVEVVPGTYTVTAAADGYQEGSRDAVQVSADTTITVDFSLAATPTAVLTPDREVAPTSPVADPSADGPSRGDVEFELSVYDSEGNLLDATGRTYTFVILNEGTNPIRACIFCGNEADGSEIATVAAGGTHIFEDVPDRNRIRVDAADPSSVRVTARTIVDGQAVEATAAVTWVAVDQEPTSAGQSSSSFGSVIAFSRAEQWYLLDSEGTTVYVEYAGASSNSYLIGMLGTDLAGFEQELKLGHDLYHSMDSSNKQIHWLHRPG